jgi:drug/metabolite transporter (DMT)-like permease
VISLRFGRRLQGRRPWIALAMATAGVGLALGGIDPSTAPGVAGLVLAVASPIIYAVWIVLAARLGGERQATDAAAREETDPAPAATVMITATLAAYLLLGGVAGARLDPRAIPAEAWIGLLGVGIFSTAVAIQGFYAGVRRIGAAQASLVSTVEPVYTIALATLLFGEVLTPVQVLGGILVIAGVLLAQTSRETGPERPLGAPAPAVRTSDAA